MLAIDIHPTPSSSGPLFSINSTTRKSEFDSHESSLVIFLLFSFRTGETTCCVCVRGVCGVVCVVVVDDDSRIQRIVLATEETTVTQQVSHRPIKCQ